MRSFPVLTFLLLAAPLALTPPPAAAETHPFAVQDLWAMRRISDPQPSPDGQQVVFVLQTTDMEANKGRTDLWLVNLDGSGLRQLTFSPESESNPRWAPDGKSIFFLSSRGGASQVWRLPMDGGEAGQVTRLPLDVGSFALSPDGARLIVSLDVFPDCDTPACTKTRLDEKEKRKASGRLYTQLFIRHWDEWNDGRRSHLFAVPVSGGEPVDLMKGMDADCPGKPFGGTEDYVFSPDGVHVVFSAKDAGREEAWSTNFDLFLTTPDGSMRRNVTGANKAWDAAPLFSPDGKWLVYKAMARPGYEADRFRIMLRPLPAGGPDRELAPDWDRSPDDLAWSADSKTLYATAENVGQRSLFAIDVGSGKARELVHDGYITAPATAGGRILFCRDHLRTPAELFSVKPDGGDLRQITDINRKAVAAARMGEPEQFSFKGANGDTVFGWVVKPADFETGKKYPVAFLIHGGPQGSFDNHFHYRWNPQVYAGHGYAAVTVDFHGSTGYGQKFTDAINDDWGGKPLEDLQKGLAAAIAKYPFLDGERVAALGASFGGYMINWIAGAWPDRFRCLVSHDGNLDELFAYYATEELWFPEWDHHGTPWDNPENFRKHSPIQLVKNWKTPILVIHGGKDYRVVDTEGISTFTAAQRRGVPSQLLYFPDEHHFVLKPANSILWHETVLGWLDRWTK